MEDKVLVLPVDSQTFEIENYSIEDVSLISSQELDTNFSQSTDYIEYYMFDGNQNLIFPSKTEELLTYTVRDGHVLLDPKQDLEREDFNEGTYYINYNFYRKRLNSSISSKYYIQEISSDRTEIRLNSNTISNDDVQSSVQEFIQYRDSQSHFVDFYLNFGDNNLIISNNIKLDVTNEEDYSAIIKLYEPLPADFNLKSQCWVIETISSAQSYQVQFPVPIFDPQDFEYIAGPNLDLNIKNESGTTSQEYSYDTLLSSNITSSNNQIQSLLDDKGIKININYDDFTNFIKFSSAKTRLENFYHKVGLIENYNSQISLLDTNVVSNTKLTSEFISSTSIFGAKVSDIIKNFDSYESFLYFNSGSAYSYPKTNSKPPYTLAATTSTEVKTWLGSSDSTNLYYGGLALQAYDFDQNNQDYLHWNIPEYLRDDSNNDQYGLFIDMVGQHFDNIWIYTKDVVNRFDADNRLDYGISKDLVADAIKDFGVKLYSNNFNTNDLYEAFLGITPSGVTFPSTGSELINTQISASNDIIPLDDTNKRLYKRIYHNIPYLLKTKGTIAGLRALITSYGIPDTILRINEFGGKNPINKQDWDLKQNIFNYALELDGNNYFSSLFTPNTNFSNSNPNTIQFRFKTPGLPENHISQSLFSIGDSGTSLLLLEYTGSSNISGSYSGSISDPYKEYGTLKYIPNTSTPSISASVYLPIFDNNWWSVMTTQNNLTASLSVANKIDNELGFLGYNEITGFNTNSYLNSTKISFPHPSNRFFNSKTYTQFSGSIQEIRYYAPNISASSFDDFVLNPYAFKGNGFGTPNQLIFRADLGTLSLTGSRESIHPKITGSWSPTSSFSNGTSDFYISSESFIKNKEYIHLNQPHQGIKNKVTDRISLSDNIIPTGDTLSSKRSLQQYSYLTQSTTPDADYLEVAFSPTNQINDDIVAELGNFNIGEYIGDPRHMSESRTNYPDLDALRDQYFLKYIKSYDVKDFIRLIKYFDNSLFKMIKDFTPARTNLSSGVVIKQHILERNAYSARPVSQEDVTYSGSVKSFARGYSTGSGDTGTYETVGGSTIEVFKGGTGGVFEKFNSLDFYKSGSDGNGPDNIFDVTQSWSDSFSSTGSNNIEYPRDDQREFYNGEFSQSAATIGIIDICGKYLNFDNVPELLYRLEYFSGSDDLYTVLPYSYPPIPVLNEYYVNYAETLGNITGACLPNGSISIFTNVSSINNITEGTTMYSDGAGVNPWVGVDPNDGYRPREYGIREIKQEYNTLNTSASLWFNSFTEIGTTYTGSYSNIDINYTNIPARNYFDPASTLPPVGGTGATFDITTNAGVITAINLNQPGSDYIWKGQIQFRSEDLGGSRLSAINHKVSTLNNGFPEISNTFNTGSITLAPTSTTSTATGIVWELSFTSATEGTARLTGLTATNVGEGVRIADTFIWSATDINTALDTLPGSTVASAGTGDYSLLIPANGVNTNYNHYVEEISILKIAKDNFLYEEEATNNKFNLGIRNDGTVAFVEQCTNYQYWRLFQYSTQTTIYTLYNPAYAVLDSVNVGGQTGCFTIQIAVETINPNRLPLPEGQYITGPCTPAPPTLYPYSLRYSTANADVCAQDLETGYKLNTPYFSTTTQVFLTNGTVAPTGYYAANNIKRFQTLTGVLQTATSCTSGGYGDLIDNNNGQFCFIAGTSIELESGIHKFIENITIGDNVITFNEETKLKETGKVYEILSPTHYDIITYLLEDGTVVSSTEDHPYYIQDGDQLKLKSKKPEDTNSRYDIDQEVYQIKLQDNMIKSDGTLSKIIDMTTERSEGTQTYLLRIDHNHNFYANGVLVHNK